jgi:hypothetical protein
MQVSWDAVMDRLDEISVWQWFALIVRDGNQWHCAEARIKGLEVLQILPTVEGSQGSSFESTPNVQK